MVLASNSTPDWCEQLSTWCAMLFPFETRQLYFACTAFGASRSVTFLDNFNCYLAINVWMVILFSLLYGNEEISDFGRLFWIFGFTGYILGRLYGCRINEMQHLKEHEDLHRGEKMPMNIESGD